METTSAPGDADSPANTPGAVSLRDGSAVKPVVVILNRSSGTAGRWRASDYREKLRDAFAHAGLECSIFVVAGTEIAEAVRRAVRSSADIIVAAGGDGTVNAVAAELAGTTKALGVLPRGTLNHFAKDIGIPLDLHKAVQVIADGHTAKVDLGEVSGRAFVNNASIGLYPRIVQGRTREQLHFGRGKWFAMFRAGLRVFKRFAQLTVTIDIDGQRETLRTPLLFVGNNRYELHGLTIGGRTAIDRGELCLYVATTAGRFAMIRLAFLALLGKLNQARDFRAIHSSGFKVESSRQRLRIALDGEVLRVQTPLEFRSRPGALRVVLPRKL